MSGEFQLHEERGMLLRASLPRQQEGEALHRIVLVERPLGAHRWVVWFQIRREDTYGEPTVDTYFTEGAYCSTREEGDEAFERRLRRGYTEDLSLGTGEAAKRTVLFDDGNGTVLSRLRGNAPMQDGIWLELGPSKCPYVHRLSDVAVDGLANALGALARATLPPIVEEPSPPCYNEHASGAVCMRPRGHEGRHLSHTMHLSWGD